MYRKQCPMRNRRSGVLAMVFRIFTPNTSTHQAHGFYYAMLRYHVSSMISARGGAYSAQAGLFFVAVFKINVIWDKQHVDEQLINQ